MKILNKVFILITTIIVLFKVNNSTSIKTFSKARFDNGEVKSIAVLLYDYQDLYMQQIKQNFEEIQKQNSNKVKFFFYNGKNNISTQLQIIDSLAKGNIDLIIVSLENQNEDILKDILLKVKPSNIPIMIINSNKELAYELSKYYNKAIFVATDSEKAGFEQGKILLDLWNNDKNTIDKNEDNKIQYILLRGNNTSSIANGRTKNMLEVLNSGGVQTEELADINAHWSRDLARDAISNLLIKYIGQIEVIIANNDDMAIGAVEALKKYGYNLGNKSKYIPVIGADGMQEAKELTNNGSMTGTVDIDAKVFTDAFYKIAMNIINNLPPTENTDYKEVNSLIIIPNNYNIYLKK